MKCISLIAVFCLLIGQVALANGKIVLEDKKENYTQTETGYILNFKLVASADEVSEIKANVANLSDRLTLVLAANSDNSFDCVFTINHQNQPEYVHKMLMSIGISAIEFKGETLPLESIVEILYSYLK